jgi:hypothetical protein
MANDNHTIWCVCPDLFCVVPLGGSTIREQGASWWIIFQCVLARGLSSTLLAHSLLLRNEYGSPERKSWRVRLRLMRPPSLFLSPRVRLAALSLVRDVWKRTGTRWAVRQKPIRKWRLAEPLWCRAFRSAAPLIPLLGEAPANLQIAYVAARGILVHPGTCAVRKCQSFLGACTNLVGTF